VVNAEHADGALLLIDAEDDLVPAGRELITGALAGPGCRLRLSHAVADCGGRSGYRDRGMPP